MIHVLIMHENAARPNLRSGHRPPHTNGYRNSGPKATCRAKVEADRLGQCIRENVSPLILIPLFPTARQYRYCCSERERAPVKGNFSIAGAVRQKTGERENKSAPSLVSGDHPWQGNGAGRQGRSWGGGVGGGGLGRWCQRRLGLQRNNVLLLYVPPHMAPWCRLTVASLV